MSVLLVIFAVLIVGIVWWALEDHGDYDDGAG